MPDKRHRPVRHRAACGPTRRSLSPNGVPGQPGSALPARSCPAGSNRRCRSCGVSRCSDDLAQRKARHMRALRRIGDPLLVVLPAPLRHQRMQRIPVLHPVGLGDEARVGAPVRRSHRRQPRRPLLLLARRDRGIAVARRQDRHRGAVAVADALAVPALAGRGRRARARSWRASPALPGSTRRSTRRAGCPAPHACRRRPPPIRR